jgi:two-component system NtrC family sensor kinase
MWTNGARTGSRPVRKSVERISSTPRRLDPGGRVRYACHGRLMLHMDKRFQMNLLRLQADLHTRLRNVGDVRKALVFGLRAAKEVFVAEEAAIAALRPGRREAELIFAIPKASKWDMALLTAYIAGDRPDIPWTNLLAPIGRWDRNWAVLALRADEKEFTTEERRSLFSVTQILADVVQSVDDARLRRVRERIEQKIADRQDPKDLIYDILHGLRSLTYYDHSASLFISRDGDEDLELVAEQIAWTKARSKRIGLRLGMDVRLTDELRKGRPLLYRFTQGGWVRSKGGPEARLPDLLDHRRASSGSVPQEVEMICAPISTPDGTVGVLKISARRSGVLAGYEARQVGSFVPLTSLAVQFAVRTESLHERILQSERKHALANLTRGITHDVNNALGAMLPLVQQMREDAKTGTMEPDTLGGDLASIEKSIQTCRRIFAGMLAIARGSARGIGHGNLRRAIDSAVSVLEDSLKRHAVTVDIDLPAELPAISSSQGDLTQIFLNLFTNARDAMPKDGRLSIRARQRDRAVEVEVADTGTGIPPELLDRLLEPFFTTKPDGSGLGLSICRSILWDIGGDLKIESERGKGTCVHVTLPVLREDGGEEKL